MLTPEQRIIEFGGKDALDKIRSAGITPQDAFNCYMDWLVERRDGDFGKFMNSGGYLLADNNSGAVH